MCSMSMQICFGRVTGVCSHLGGPSLVVHFSSSSSSSTVYGNWKHFFSYNHTKQDFVQVLKAIKMHTNKLFDGFHVLKGDSEKWRISSFLDTEIASQWLINLQNYFKIVYFVVIDTTYHQNFQFGLFLQTFTPFKHLQLITKFAVFLYHHLPQLHYRLLLES